jgi:hypothetical protein
MNESMDFLDPVAMMSHNMGNISAIQPNFALQLSRADDTFLQDIQMLNTNRSKFSKLSINPKNTPMSGMDINDFSPFLRRETEDELFPSSPEGKNRLDASSCIVMEDDYKAIRLENNLEHLNKDIEKVNDEIEQIKKMLF